MIGTLTERAQARPYWEYAARLLLAAAADDATGDDVREAWAQMRRALVADGMLLPG